MKKNMVWIVLGVIVLVVLVLGYLGRHKIKALLGMSSAPVQTSPTASTPPVVPSGNIYMAKTDAKKGNYMTDFQGMTLYTFDKDTNGISNCYNGCAQIWPPYTSGAVAQSNFPPNISVITRTDGSKQFAWNGKPLYYYASDTKAGDTMGDGVGGTWHIVKI
jgi:predicted lipoprotein with Yx(FWY)xxD motif